MKDAVWSNILGIVAFFGAALTMGFSTAWLALFLVYTAMNLTILLVATIGLNRRLEESKERLLDRLSAQTDGDPWMSADLAAELPTRVLGAGDVVGRLVFGGLATIAAGLANQLLTAG